MRIMSPEEIQAKKDYYEKWLREHGEEPGKCEFAGDGCKLYCKMSDNLTIHYRLFTCESANGFTYSGPVNNIEKEMCQLKELLLEKQK